MARAAGLAVVLVLAAVLSTALVTRFDGSVPEQPQVVRIVTGSPAAVYYKYGEALATIINRELPGVHATVLVTAASVTNVELIRQGRAELAFTQADVLDAGGNGPPEGSLAALARVYDDQLHLVVRAASPVQTLDDLRGRRVSVGAAGSGTFFTVRRLLRVAGLAAPGAVRASQLGLDASVTALRAGDLDAFFFSGGLPVQAIERLAGQTRIRLVDLGEWVPGLRQAHSAVYEERGVPASAYELRQPTTTIGVPNYLVVPGSLPEWLAFDLTRILIERRDELAQAHPAAEWLDSRTAIYTTPLDLHPGAVRYYRDRKS